ncbi:MAG: helix-turn-helix domain-containing protein [Chloroflexi bacterium]|nr:helix-turn-helix domain-containing protein [Chloroflexota bacterium]
MSAFNSAARLYFADWERLGPPALPGRTTRARENEAKVLRALGGWIGEDARCWPTIRAIATACQLGKTTVERALRRLVDAGLLKTRRRGRRVVYVVVHFVGVVDRVRRSRAVARTRGKAAAHWERIKGWARSVDNPARTRASARIPDSEESQRRVDTLDRNRTGGPQMLFAEAEGIAQKLFGEGIADLKAKLTGEPPTALPSASHGANRR